MFLLYIVPCSSLRQETRVVTHHHLGFKLPHGIKHDTDNNQQGCTTEQLIRAYASDKWHNCHNAQEQGTSKRNAIENSSQVSIRWLTRTIPGDKGTLLLQILWNVLLLPQNIGI